MKNYFADLFDKIIKKPCNIRMMDENLVTIIEILQSMNLNKKIEVFRDGRTMQMAVKFKATYVEWTEVLQEIETSDMTKVFTVITDQFGQSHDIELA